MSELKHWLDEASEADEFERAILRAGLEADPPNAKRDQVWSGLMATLALAPLAAATTSVQAAGVKTATAGLSKAAAVWLAVGKGFVVGLAIYGAVEGMGEISNRLSVEQAPAPTEQRATTQRPAATLLPEPRAAASALALPLPPAPDAPSTLRSTQHGSASANVSAQARNVDKAAGALPSVATFDDSVPPDSTRMSQLEAEARALRQARAELRAGKLGDAFATLEASRRQFPAPELHQEREALMIELLFRGGQVTAAEQRARAFISRFPDSPHLQQIRRFTAD
ncbi:MAG TPA: hypothetical protein VJV79_04665 [Polyangiaceae bacterium]|nr:hypothetical protein [Polyangiaceae bacterium]